jgi:hypothetical protein
MARKSIQYYSYTPGAANAGTVKIPDVYQLKDILMITNVTRNVVIYNFSDSTRGAYAFSANENDTTTFVGYQNGVTTLTLALDTSTHNAADKLMIYVEATEMRVRTHDFGIDAVERQRVAQPESMIDADFEYGLQQTKWASWTTVFNTPTTYELPGSDVLANVYGYATLVATPISSAATTSLVLTNQGLTPTVPYIGNTAPVHNQFDYKILVNQGLGTSTTSPRGTTWIANAAVTNGALSISAANGGPSQRSFTVTRDIQYWNAGDVAALIGIPSELGDAALMGTAISSVGTTTFTLNAAGTIVNNDILAIETVNGGEFELCYVSSGGTTTTLTVSRQLFGTNYGGANLPLNARMKRIRQAGAADAGGAFASNVEIVRVDSVDQSLNQLHVTRGFMNTNAAVQFLPGTIVGKVNMFGELSPGLGNGLAAVGTGTNANIEIVRVTTPAIGPLGSQTVVRGALGTIPLSTITVGSLAVTAAGVFVAGNVNVPVIGVNANAHGVASSMQGAGPFGLSTAVAGTANANAFISTLGLSNANVEGIYFNLINDVHYAAYYPKIWPNREIGWQLNPVAATQDVTIRKGGTFTGANIQYASIVSNAGIPSAITVTTQQPHGLYPGQLVSTNLYGAVAANTHASGIFTINSVPFHSQFTFIAKPSVAVTTANALVAALGTQSTIFGNIMMFPTSLVRHRPVDGGTNMGVNAPAFGYEVVRQTKKYFRYQSGKGMMFTTGISLSPQFVVTNVAAAGTSIGSAITITTELDHGVQIGANIQLAGLTTSGYNSFYRVASVVSQNAFTVVATATLGATTPTFGSFPQVALLNWHGGKVRVGMFDDQNGVYWHYDGQQLAAGKRSSTRDLLGRCFIGQNQSRVNGDRNTRFLDQLLAGDQVVIRGMSHTVMKVESNNTMYVTPAYRGVINAENAKISATDDVITYQSSFNKDKMDGTGPSGYVIDKSKMQMVAIQYTWYGAGFIDWGMRTTDGQMIWAHRTKNNNVNNESFMRSGNLPARYKTANNTAYVRLATALVANETGNINLGSTTGFPTANVTYPATVLVAGIGSEVDELVTYTAGPFAANGNISGLTRGAVYSAFNLGAIRSQSMGVAGVGVGTTHAVNSSVRLYSVTASPDLNHWGSAVILDGGFTKDRSYQFTYNVANTNILGTQVQTVFMMRLAPSITNAITGDLGAKDVINRAQLLLQNMYVNISDSAATLKPRFLLQAILNPTNILSANFAPLNQRFNAQNTGGQSTTPAGSGGFNQPSFTQFVANVYPSTAHPTTMWGVNTIVFDQSPRGHHNGQPYAQGGEQLFSIPVSAQNSGFIDLSNIKEIGGASLPGTGFYPNGNEIVAFNIVPAQGAQANVDIQITYVESQA